MPASTPATPDGGMGASDASGSDWLRSRPPPRITGDGLVLRQPELDDDDALTTAVRASLPELQPWMPWATPDYGPVESRQWIERARAGWVDGSDMPYVVLEADAPDRPVGTIGLMARIRPGWLEVGYWVRTSHTGRRIARRAGGLLVTAARTHLPEVEGLEIHHDEGNHASASVPRALGFTWDHVADRSVDAPGETGRTVVWRLTLAGSSGEGGPARSG